MLSIENYEANGVAWPFELSSDFKGINLEERYFGFQERATEIFGKKVSVKPNLLSPFFLNKSK